MTDDETQEGDQEAPFPVEEIEFVADDETVTVDGSDIEEARVVKNLRGPVVTETQAEIQLLDSPDFPDGHAPLSATIRASDGMEVTADRVHIETLGESRQRSQDLREQAPDREHLTDEPTQEIDAVIEALEEARDQGVERVLVNDDGRTRGMHPVVTNNFLEHSPLAPRPKELFEWVEL